MEKDEKLDALERTCAKTRRALYALQNECTAAVKAEEDRIRAKFSERLAFAIKLKYAAETALEDHQKEIAQRAAETFVSKKYHEIKYARWSGRIEGTTGRVGYTEVITGESVHPGNTSSRAALGDIVLRILKKDGTPSARYECSGYGGIFFGWRAGTP
jgi:hypothetical protein